MENLEWALFSAGVLAGFAEAEAQNLGNDCLSDAATIIFSAVHSYNYMMDYVETNQTDNIALAYGLTYIIMGFDTYANIDCSTLEDDIENWNSNNGNAELVSSAPNYLVQSF